MRIFTIGFTRKSAEEFFDLLEGAGVQRVVDIRLHNTSQLAGFTKQDDLKFFLDQVAGINYIHLPILAPTEELMQDYRKKRIKFDEFRERFTALLAERKIEQRLSPRDLHGGCLLCSEPAAKDCHRSFVAEYLAQAWDDVEVVHL
jgi:uncharacterized protein (DUF488 family)